jgi:hypothetical protein
VHSRRARPTLRLLSEDLTAGWDSVYAPRLIANGCHDELHPLSELPHPIVIKAAQAIGHDGARDNIVGQTRCSTKVRLLEIKCSQWRGGVWQDSETGVHWLVVAGLAKGDHEDHEDFYKQVERENLRGNPHRWLPTAADMRLLKQETAARLLTEAELAIQQQVLAALREVHAGGSTAFTVNHPAPGKGIFAEIRLCITPIRESGYSAEEVEVEVLPAASYRGSQLAWDLTIRVLIALDPPEQGWDRHQDCYSNIGEPGRWTTRITELAQAVADGILVESEPGRYSHYAHRQHLAGSTIEGRSVRTLCGVFLVPTQDHEKLPPCPDCELRRSKLPP